MSLEKTGEATLDWLRSGADPRFSFGVDWWQGEDFLHRPFKLGGVDGAIVSRLTPMSWNQAYTTMRDEGAGYAAAQLPLDAAGLRANTYADNPNRPKTTAEKLAQRFAERDYRSKPQDEATKKKLDELKQRARAGEDVSGELRPLVENETITERRADSIANAANQSYLQDKFRQLSLEDAEHVLRYATPDEKASVEEIMRAKRMNKVVKDTKEQERLDNPERAEALKRRSARAQQKKRMRQELRYGDQLPTTQP
jgi:hypothetical protein